MAARDKAEKVGSPRDVLGDDWGGTDLQPDRKIPGHSGAVLASLLATQVLEARTRLRLSQAKLARAAGVSPNTISRLEDGTTWPDFRTIGAVAAALNLPLVIALRDKPQRRLVEPYPPAPVPMTSIQTASQAITYLLASVPSLDREVARQLPQSRQIRRTEQNERREARRKTILNYHGTR